MRKNKKIDDVKREIDTIKLNAYGWACRTALSAAIGAAAILGNMIVNNSERAYSAMHYLIFGRLP